MSIQALREQRGKIAKSLQDLVGKDDWNEADDQPKYDASMAEIDRIDAKIERIQAANDKLAEETRTDALAEISAKKGRDGGDRGLEIYAKWLKGGDRALNEDDWNHVRNAMSTTTGSEGGFTVDSEVANSVLDALKAYGGMRSVATVIQTSGVGGMSFPTSDGTAEEGEIVAENQEATDQDISFGAISLPVYKFSSKVVAVPMELLQDSNVDIEAFVNGRLVTRLGRITNRLFTTGTGISQPHGVNIAAQIGTTAANGSSQVTAVTYDSLVNLQHSVDPAYRERGTPRFMFNDATLREVRKVKDSSGRPIFVPGYDMGNPQGAPDRLLGAPITINQDMPSMAANARSILYGDFSPYYIRDVMAVEMFRFTDSAYTKKGQVGFLAWMRSGGNLIDVGGAVKAFVNAAS
ncbi:phage major capsid protein [Jannaschia formosa]|uniref:phage major capsid protein n=1 Tax=Jannaschia formosa TaxID=2259592 RepID=UPI000E1BC6EB|nr:phage major capsid protein [Jannaschia formosa]TFL16425.1 phage major capsid protein [Jannaschia formosa]